MKINLVFYNNFHKKVFIMVVVLITISICFVSSTTLAEISFGDTHGKISRIIITEYFDYNCPVCRVYSSIINAVAQNNPNIKIVQRVIPVFAVNSPFIDSMVLAAYQQHNFAAMQNAILQTNYSESIPNRAVFSIANKLHLNRKKLLADSKSSLIRNQLIENINSFARLRFHGNTISRIPVTVISKLNNKLIQKASRRMDIHKIVVVGWRSVTYLQRIINQLQAS